MDDCLRNCRHAVCDLSLVQIAVAASNGRASITAVRHRQDHVLVASRGSGFSGHAGAGVQHLPGCQGCVALSGQRHDTGAWQPCAHPVGIAGKLAGDGYGAVVPRILHLVRLSGTECPLWRTAVPVSGNRGRDLRSRFTHDVHEDRLRRPSAGRYREPAVRSKPRRWRGLPGALRKQECTRCLRRVADHCQHRDFLRTDAFPRAGGFRRWR